MKILVACEYTGVVRNALRAAGHDAWSNDITECEDGSPYHIRGDALEVAYDRSHRWDGMVSHAPCTYIANSGAKHLYIGMKKENGVNPERWQAMIDGAEFFRDLWNAPIDRIAAENPIMLGYAVEIVGCTHDQVIQPWMFGHLEVKATTLRLKNLPKLVPTCDVRVGTMALPYGERARVHYASPGPNRGRERSRTLPGIAAAMASQWFLV